MDNQSTFKDTRWIILWLHMQMASLQVQQNFVYSWEHKLYINNKKARWEAPSKMEYFSQKSCSKD